LASDFTEIQTVYPQTNGGAQRFLRSPSRTCSRSVYHVDGGTTTDYRSPV